jgi:hypothetical protein
VPARSPLHAAAGSSRDEGIICRELAERIG